MSIVANENECNLLLVQKTSITSVDNFVNGSSKSKGKFKELADELDLYHESIKKRNETRWIGEYKAMKSIANNYLLLLHYMRREITTKSKSRSNDSQFLFNELKSTKFILLPRFLTFSKMRS